MREWVVTSSQPTKGVSGSFPSQKLHRLALRTQARVSQFSKDVIAVLHGAL
jgi:hypothetical protein